MLMIRTTAVLRSRLDRNKLPFPHHRRNSRQHRQYRNTLPSPSYRRVCQHLQQAVIQGWHFKRRSLDDGQILENFNHGIYV